jgi:type II restriction enzyme
MSKIKEAQKILKALGLPAEQQNEMAALTLLALVGVSPAGSWENATKTSLTVTKGIMTFAAERYHKKYAPNTRETFRRHVLHQFVQGCVADYNPDNPSLPTNSPNAHYAISDAALTVIRAWKTKNWEIECEQFRQQKGSLLELYNKKRTTTFVPVCLPAGEILKLSPGRHNQLQAAVIKEFGPRFAQGAHLLYFGDTAKKNLLVDNITLGKLNVAITEHNKLPDVVLYDRTRNWLFLIEVVTSHGPMTPKRVVELKEMFAKCSAGIIFVSVFPDFAQFRKHLKNIAWETEVWIAEIPDHLIHYNGDKFLGPR